MVYCETPTNPMMHLADLAAVGDLTQARGLLLAVDNTFATPIFQRPLESGADIVLHSTTKYLNGHSDMVGGLLVTDRDDLAERIGFLQNAAGARARARWTAGSALRGIKTLPLRMRQHDANGRRIAEWLSRTRRRQKIYYPGLAVASPARAGQAADERLRRHDLVRPGRRRRRPAGSSSGPGSSRWPNRWAAWRA